MEGGPRWCCSLGFFPGTLRYEQLGEVEMFPLVKFLSRKNEDLSLAPRTHVNKTKMGCGSVHLKSQCLGGRGKLIPGDY